MMNVLGSPTKYLQGNGILNNLASCISTIGSRAILIIDKNMIPIVLPTITASFEQTNFSYEIIEFSGECCMTEIYRIQNIIQKCNCDIVIGIGGGKTLDTTKAVSHYTAIPMVIVPTSASSDAPCSSLSVLYHDDHTFDKYLYLAKSPDMVFVDSEIISKAPARLLAAGMGDALSTYFETRACSRSQANNSFHGKQTIASLALAKACHDMLLEDGATALACVKEKRCTEEVEHIIEANIYLSGIGFESGGLAAAHAIAYALDILPATRKFMHGEKVAFGTLVQLYLEYVIIQTKISTAKKESENLNYQLSFAKREIETVTEFCKSIGLPASFSDMNLADITQEELMQIAKAACTPDSTIHNMPFAVTEKDVYVALLVLKDI